MDQNLAFLIQKLYIIPLLILRFFLLCMLTIQHAASILPMVFSRMLFLIGQSHLYDELEYALFHQYEYQIVFQDILKTWQNIQCAIQDNLFFLRNPIPAVFLLAFQKISIKQNQSCFFFLLYLFFFLPVILLCLILLIFHNHQVLKCQNRCRLKFCMCNFFSARFLSYQSAL